mgnify:CR=1 FL=1
MDFESLSDLYVHELRDLYSAEKQIQRILPKVARCTQSAALKQAILRHAEETRMHITRLEDIFERMGKSTRGTRCRGIDGIIEEAEAWLDEDANHEVMDAGIIAALQRIEHYEIAGYGCVRTYANLLKLAEDESLLAETLEEERDTDKTLSLLAKEINFKAREAVV